MITRIVDTGVRELRCIWAREMAQDISMYHSIDIEKELTKQLKRNKNSENQKNNHLLKVSDFF